MTIFISIAAYRDPELLPTILHCIQQARYPNDLRFGICWQHATDEPRPSEFDDRRIRVLDVLWHQSRGTCWARAEIMQLWNNEDWYLQLDSHHRFSPGWDAKLLDHAGMTGVSKPILSTYAAAFNPREPLPKEPHPTQMNFNRFNKDGIALFTPGIIPHWRDLCRPVRARFVSGHFLFAPGGIVSEVPYDPELYFLGEEITFAIRAFTHGYDLFHSHEHIMWHEYTRVSRNKHWDDHVKAQNVEVEWHQRQAVSHQKVRRLLLAPYLGRFGLGTVRTFADYEAYAGLSFQHRVAQDETVRGLEPPNPVAPRDWATALRNWSLRIELDRDALPLEACDNPRLWYVGVHDDERKEIHRRDVTSAELRVLLGSGNARIVIERVFQSATRPVTWTVWPVNAEGGWLAKITGDASGATSTSAASGL